METQNEKLCTYSKSKEIILPVFDALDALRGRWRLPILISLMFGSKRFTELSKEVEGISDKVLAKELKELKLNQLIERTVHDTFPPTVEYSITPHGKSVEMVMIELKNWGGRHRKQILGL
jgi:DNA-binding HxlR family transcriptional regulator